MVHYQQRTDSEICKLRSIGVPQWTFELNSNLKYINTQYCTVPRSFNSTNWTTFLPFVIVRSE